MARGNFAWLLVVPLSFGLLVAISYSSPVPGQRDGDYARMRIFAEVFSEVERNYVRELDDAAKTKLLEDMINGGLEKLDPYSSYFNLDEYRSFNTQNKGDFGGVGIQLTVDPKTGTLMVLSPMVGTPAYEAGILAGDLILKVDGESTEGWRINDIVKKVQGEPGTPITMTILHEGAKDPEEITVKRARIEIATVLGYQRKPENPKEWDYFVDAEKKLAYIRIVQFNEHTTEDVKKAMEKIEAEGGKGLILDLRDNPGGLLSSATEISDLFLKEGRIVSTKDRNDKGRTWDAKASGTTFEPAKDHPIAVLINKNSASASEIVAAALQDNHRAAIVGERSFGKGSVQKVIELGPVDAPTALKLTTDSYWRPNGKNIHRHANDKESDEWGVKPDPDYAVQMKDTERLAYARHRRERDIIRNDASKKDPAPAFEDKYLQKGLDYLKKELGYPVK